MSGDEGAVSLVLTAEEAEALRDVVRGWVSDGGHFSGREQPMLTLMEKLGITPDDVLDRYEWDNAIKRVTE